MASARYNWLGGGANGGSTSFFRNFAVGSAEAPAWKAFLAENAAHQATSSVTLPTLGFVAKDETSYAFPVASLGPQAATAPKHPDVGNGIRLDRKRLPAPDPSVTSRPAAPDLVARWVTALRATEGERASKVPRAPLELVLGHEPLRWHRVHADLHPLPVTDEALVERTVEYAKAVRAAAPEAFIVSPSFSGFTDLIYSARDVETGLAQRPDRRKHGEVPLLTVFLRRLHEAGQKRAPLLNALNVHWFPQGKGLSVGKEGRTDPLTAAQRIRSTRSLWSADHRDESWIGQPVRLFPRLKEAIAASYPGLQISLGEYGFGAEEHMSGGLALAEALGRIAEANLHSAYHWKYPPRGSPAYWAFRAFRNFDGLGAGFESELVPTSSPDGTSLFASRDASGSRLVLVALNFDPERAVKAIVQTPGCRPVKVRRLFTYAGGNEGLVLVPPAPDTVALALEETLAPYSINVFDLRLEEAKAPR